MLTRCWPCRCDYWKVCLAKGGGSGSVTGRQGRGSTTRDSVARGWHCKIDVLPVLPGAGAGRANHTGAAGTSVLCAVKDGVVHKWNYTMGTPLDQMPVARLPTGTRSAPSELAVWLQDNPIPVIDALWTSTGALGPEAACVQAKCHPSMHRAAACATRVLPALSPQGLHAAAAPPLAHAHAHARSPAPAPLAPPPPDEVLQAPEDALPAPTPELANRRRRRVAAPPPPARPNLLVLLLDPISDPHFSRALPQTEVLLGKLGFVRYSNYSVVGFNSGPNQVALYAGQELEGRGAVRRVTERQMWLWDQLRRTGYQTLKAEDNCVKNSNMVQSMLPNVTHGTQLHELFCYEHVRPGCLGGKRGAEHLLDYASHFIHHSQEVARSPWASFLHFTDSHEDSMALAGVLDKPLSRFLLKATQLQNNTVILVMSDHGMHYGPYYQTYHGQREHRNPLLRMWFPKAVCGTGEGCSAFAHNVLANKDAVVTPFDVHATLQDLLGLEPHPGSKGRGASLVRTVIPASRSCEQVNCAFSHISLLLFGGFSYK